MRLSLSDETHAQVCLNGGRVAGVGRYLDYGVGSRSVSILSHSRTCTAYLAGAQRDGADLYTGLKKYLRKASIFTRPFSPPIVYNGSAAVK